MRGAEHQPPAIADHPWKRFVAIGDSITEGYGMDPVDGVEHLPWVERVARALAAAGADPHRAGSEPRALT